MIRPNPPRLSALGAELQAIEESGIFSNNGPTVRRFETELVERLFGGQGAAMTVSNATLGLMIAIRQAAGARIGEGRFALMPSFTFAATAQAAIWAGLTPLLCDIDPNAWMPSAEAEEALLRTHGQRISVIVPYATFGNALDMERYEWLSRRHSIPVVVDAAASLGTRDAKGRGFATGTTLTTVFSMHATKTFATAEGGVVYSADPELIRTFRIMANFGFDAGRSATMPGLNAKLSEIGGLLALTKLQEIDDVVDHRASLARAYRAGLPGFTFQQELGTLQAYQFMPVLLPERLAASRRDIMAKLAGQGIGCGAYFSPHLAEQPYFQTSCLAGPLPVTEEIAGRILALPIADTITHDQVATVCQALREACGVGVVEKLRPARGGPPARIRVAAGPA